MKDDEKIEETWDKKKIVFAVIFLTFLLFAAYEFKNYILSNNLKTNVANIFKKPASGSVEGASSENLNPQANSNNSSLPSTNNLKTEAQSKLDIIRQEITKLNILDVATSTPQVQKIIQDIQSLEKYPGNQAKDMCEKICNGL